MTTSTETRSLALQGASAFALHRDKKLHAHTGDEQALPRYLTFSSASKGNVQNNHSGSTNNATSVGISGGSVVKRGNIANGLLGGLIQKVNTNTLSSMESVPAVTSNSGSSDQISTTATDELSCATGTCSFRPRQPLPATGEYLVTK